MEKITNGINNILKISIIIFLIFVAFFMSSMSKNIQSIGNESFSIKGQAELIVEPDAIKYYFDVNEYHKNQKQALDSINKKNKGIIDILEKYNIDKKDIKTNNYSLTQRYNWNEGKRTFDKYYASQRTEVVIRDFKKGEEIMAEVSNSDVDRISLSDFYVEKPEDYKKKLRELAIADAKENAAEIEKSLGIKLDKIIDFHENSNDIYSNLYESESVNIVSDQKISAPVINSGSQKLTSNVSISYLVEN